MAGSLWATWADRPAPLGRRPAPRLPLWHYPRHQSVGAVPQALPLVDLSQFQPMVTMKRTWIHGPIVIGLEPHQPTY
jgi:hypothetical protein